MKRIIRLTERDLTRLVKRVIREEEMSDDLPICSSKMSSGGVETGGSSQMTGIDKITYNGSVSPQYQGYTVHKNGRPFCFIKRS